MGSKVYVYCSGRGGALVARASISAGEQVDVLPGRVDFMRVLAHSLCPNCEIQGQYLTALQSIAVGQELTCDHRYLNFQEAGHTAC